MIETEEKKSDIYIELSEAVKYKDRYDALVNMCLSSLGTDYRGRYVVKSEVVAEYLKALYPERFIKASKDAKDKEVD